MKKSSIVAVLLGIALISGISIAASYVIVADKVFPSGKGIAVLDVGADDYLLRVLYFDTDRSGGFTSQDLVISRDRVNRTRPITPVITLRPSGK